MENPEYALQLLRRVRELAPVWRSTTLAGFTSLSHFALSFRHAQGRSVAGEPNAPAAAGNPALGDRMAMISHGRHHRGAETESDAVELSQLGCEFAQGYAFGER